MRLPGRFNRWMTEHNTSLSAWSSLVTLVSLPLVLAGMFLSYYQVVEILALPQPELRFVHPTSVAYKVANNSSKTAEDVLVSFGLFDLDDLSRGPLPIPSVKYDYVNRHSEKGPFKWFGNFAVTGHQYFGIVYIGCKGGDRLRTYWIYVKHGDPTESFYAERNKDDTFRITFPRLPAAQRTLLDTLVPVDRRKYIRE